MCQIYTIYSCNYHKKPSFKYFHANFLKTNIYHYYRDLFRPVDWNVFVHDLNRQLGTPSHWLPVDSCKKENKEAP